MTVAEYLSIQVLLSTARLLLSTPIVGWARVTRVTATCLPMALLIPHHPLPPGNPGKLLQDIRPSAAPNTCYIRNISPEAAARCYKTGDANFPRPNKLFPQTPHVVKRVTNTTGLRRHKHLTGSNGTLIEDSNNQCFQPNQRITFRWSLPEGRTHHTKHTASGRTLTEYLVDFW